MAEQGTSKKRNVRDDVGTGTESEAAENEGADSGQGGTAMGRTTGFALGGSSAEGKEGSDDSSTYKEMKGGRSTGVKGGSRTGGNAGGGHGSTGGKGKKRASKAGSKGSSKGGGGKGGSRGGEGGRGGATRPAIKPQARSKSGRKAGTKKR